MTKNEFKNLMEEKGFQVALEELMNLEAFNGKVASREWVMSEMRDSKEYHRVKTLAFILLNNVDSKYFRFTHDAIEFTPIKAYEDIEDLLEEDKLEMQEINLEFIKEWLVVNHVGISDVFEEDHLKAYIRSSYDASEIFDRDDIKSSFDIKESLNDFDEDDIKEYVGVKFDAKDIFNENEIKEAFDIKESLDDFDEDDIIDWVRDNAYVEDLVDIEWR